MVVVFFFFFFFWPGTQEEAAEAYDIAAIKFRGLNAVTNFDMSRYDVNSIVASNLPIGSMAGRMPKVASDSSSSPSDTRNADSAKPVDARAPDHAGSSTAAPFALAMPFQQHQDYWPLLALPQQQQQRQQASDQSSSPSFTVYPSAVSMNFSSATATVVGPGNGSLLLNSGMLQHHQQQHQQQQQQLQQGQINVCSIPYATPIALGSSSYEAAGYRGGWVTPVASPMHTYEQAAKTRMGYFQTPIFGVE